MSVLRGCMLGDSKTTDLDRTKIEGKFQLIR